MLPPENEPFANAHIQSLDNVKDLLTRIANHDELDVDKTSLNEAIDRLSNAQNALVRYRVCFADEVQQKDLYRNRWLALRFPKQDR